MALFEKQTKQPTRKEEAMIICRSTMTIAILIICCFLRVAFAGSDISSSNEGNIYKYDPMKERIDISFFPKDKARWDGYKVRVKDWKQFNGFQKSNFVFEGAKELQRNKQTVIDYGEKSKDLWNIVGLIDLKIDAMEKQSSLQDMPLIDFLFNIFKEEKMIQWDKKPLEEKRLVLGRDCGMGFTHILAGDSKGAIPYLVKAIQLNPDDAEAYYFLGAAYRSLGQYKEAKENLKEAKELYQSRGDYQKVESVEQDFNKLP